MASAEAVIPRIGSLQNPQKGCFVIRDEGDPVVAGRRPAYMSNLASTILYVED
jgi:hypothetical protein